MGQIAEDMADGTTCCLCGSFFDDGEVVHEGWKVKSCHTHGYPVVCWDCWKELTKGERRQYQRAERPTI